MVEVQVTVNEVKYLSNISSNNIASTSSFQSFNTTETQEHETHKENSTLEISSTTKTFFFNTI